jgi:HEAT repeat protein
MDWKEWLETDNQEKSNIRSKITQQEKEKENSLLILIKKLKHLDKQVRIQTANKLSTLKDSKAVQPLIEALRDEQWEVRREAACALGEIGDKKAVEPLIELLQGNLLSVRRAAYGLGELGDKQTEESLIKALEDQQYRVRERAIETLGKIGVEATNLILDNEIGEVRRGAINALMIIRDERVILPLIEALKEELKLFYKAKDYGDDYEYFLAEELEELRELIGHLGEKAVLPLIEVLKNNTHRDVKHFAVVHLGRSADVRAVQPLIEVLDNEDDVERRAVTRGLTSIGTIRGYEYIVEPIFQLLRMRGVKIRR